MSEYSFLQNPVSKQWIVLAPRRAKRPDIFNGSLYICPFCMVTEKNKNGINRDSKNITDLDWEVRVVSNKYPFSPNHEIIIHSPDHHKNFDELPLKQVARIISVFRDRFNSLKKFGQVYIFHNHGESGGESVSHPHTQILTIPADIKSNIEVISTINQEIFEINDFLIICPTYSQWPDEVWIVPKKRGELFGRISDIAINKLAQILQRVIQLMDIRHGQEFPYNFYIYPNNDWYLRIIPRYKILGGFEIGTNIYVNTQDPKETLTFIKNHYYNKDVDKIREHKAEYKRAV